MYYHGWFRLHQGSSYYWTNVTKDLVIEEYLFPFINRQVRKYRYDQDSFALVNMTSATQFRCFKTEDVLTQEELAEFRKNGRIGIPCTNELVDEVRIEISTEIAKSLLQKMMQPTRKQIFVIMKFNDAELDSSYQRVIKPIGEEYGYEVIRIDDIEDSELITDQILEGIAVSEIIYSDLTGERPNCYFETGITMALGRNIILTIKSGFEPHFDLKGYRCIEWESELDLEQKLRKRLESIIESKKFTLVSP